MHFIKTFKRAIRNSGSHLCIGLDSDIRNMPAFLKNEQNPVLKFNSLIIESTSDLVAAYKFNIAFYEFLGDAAWSTLKSSLSLIPSPVFTIADAKRGDIENTSELYARTFFDELNFDSITIHPYMGSDSVRPFIRRKNKFVFLLVLTSNFGAKDFQFLKVNNKPLYKIVIEKAVEWNDHKIGFVVGANHTTELKNISTEFPETPLLIPGIGKQKNSLSDTIKALKHRMFIINQSRSVIYSAQNAVDEQEFKEKIRESALKAKDEINNFLLLHEKKPGHK